MQFTAYPLDPRNFLIRWPQSLVDATHYYNTIGCDRFFVYLRARHQGWPEWLKYRVLVQHDGAWSAAGDAIKAYS